LLGAAIYRAILIDQHSLRSHPNKAVDVDPGGLADNASSTLVLPSTTKSRGDCPLAFGLFPLAG